MQVLLIGNEEGFLSWLEPQLGEAGLSVMRVDTIEQAIRAEQLSQCGAILLDLNSHDAQGDEQVRAFRKAGYDHPLLVLSAQGSWRDRVDCLDAGADDYLIKPLRIEELCARLRAVVRRFAGCSSNRTSSGDIEVELAARQVWLAGELLDLTRNEFRLLRLFMLRPGKIHSQQDLQEHLYAGIGESSANSLEVQIARLRRKIGKDRIMTVRGMGYRIVGAEDGGGRKLKETSA